MTAPTPQPIDVQLMQLRAKLADLQAGLFDVEPYRLSDEERRDLAYKVNRLRGGVPTHMAAAVIETLAVLGWRPAGTRPPAPPGPFRTGRKHDGTIYQQVSDEPSDDDRRMGYGYTPAHAAELVALLNCGWAAQTSALPSVGAPGTNLGARPDQRQAAKLTVRGVTVPVSFLEDNGTGVWEIRGRESMSFGVLLDPNRWFPIALEVQGRRWLGQALMHSYGTDGAFTEFELIGRPEWTPAPPPASPVQEEEGSA